jgi:tape measure domain-containing protein
VSVVANVAINVDSRAAVSKLRDVQSQAGATQRAFDGLGAAVGKLAAAFGGIQAAEFIFAKTAELESQTRSLQVLTGSAQKAKQIIEELQQLGAVTPFTSTELVDAAKRLQAFGVEANNVVETTKRLADVSGATGAELQGLVTAYGQVQAKGRLQGEELLQFQERGVALQAELRKMYGLSGDEFQKALEKGRISAQAVEVAIQRLTSAGGKYANGAIAQSDTLSGRLSTLQDGIEVLARGIGTALSPAIKAVLNEAIFAINTINQLIATGARARGFGLGQGQRKDILNQAREEALDILGRTSQTGRRISNPFERGRLIQELTAQRERDLIEAYGIRTGQVKPAAAPPAMAAGAIGAAPKLLAPSSGGGGGSNKAAREAERAAEAAAKEADRVSQVIRDRLAEGQMMQLRSTIQDQIAAAEMAGNEQLVVRLKGQEKQLDIEYRYAQLLAQEKDIKAQEAIIYVGNTEQIANQRDIQRELNQLQNESARNQIAALQVQVGLQAQLTEGQKRMEQLRTEFAQLTNLESISITAADNIGGAFGRAFQEIINGSSSAQEALASMMRSIGENFVNMAVQIIAQQTTMVILGTILKALGIGGGGGGGGFSYQGVTGNPLGTSMISGNFTPTPFSTAGLSFRANGGPVSAGAPYVVGEHGPELFVPGRNGSVVSNSGLRDAMGAAPGSGGSPVLNMSFQTTSIGGVEYVSREQLEAAMAETRRQATRDGASRGMSMTLDRIKQSPQTRSRIGIR